jgi:hypothetical protein
VCHIRAYGNDAGIHDLNMGLSQKCDRCNDEFTHCPEVLSTPLQQSQDVQTVIEANGSSKLLQGGTTTLQETSKRADQDPTSQAYFTLNAADIS